MVKSRPSGCRERLEAEARHQGDAGGPLKASGLQRLLVVLEGELLEVTHPAQPGG